MITYNSTQFHFMIFRSLNQIVLVFDNIFMITAYYFLGERKSKVSFHTNYKLICMFESKEMAKNVFIFTASINKRGCYPNSQILTKNHYKSFGVCCRQSPLNFLLFRSVIELVAERIIFGWHVIFFFFGGPAWFGCSYIVTHY